jgi:hypothetical protein
MAIRFHIAPETMPDVTPPRRAAAEILGLKHAGASPRGATYWKRLRRCPREHALANILRLVPIRDNDALTTGFLIHHGLEVYYRTLMGHQKALDAQGAPRDDEYFFGGIARAEEAAWNALDPISREPGYTESSGNAEPTWNVVQRVLVNYFDRYRRQDRWRILMVEETLQWTDPELSYSARLDLVIEDASKGEMWIVEHKTTRAITSNMLEGYALDMQVLGQIWLFRQCMLNPAGETLRGVVVNILGKQKQPQFERIPTIVTDAHLQAFEASIRAWNRVEEVYAALGYPQAFGACAGADRGFQRCPYFDLCHTYPHAGIEAIAKLNPPPDGFVHGEGGDDDDRS